MIFWHSLLLIIIFALPAQAAHWLLAVEHETVLAGKPLQVELVRPDSGTPWPSQVILRLIGVGTHEMVVRQKEAINSSRRLYEGSVPARLEGVMKVEAISVKSNRLLLDIKPGDKQGKPVASVAEEVSSDVAMAHTAASDDVDLGLAGISLNEPSYFILGAKDGMDARFQYSFKYQLFDELGPVAQAVPWLGDMFIGYTQTSLWDLGSDSAPFRDTSYRPSIFWQKTNAGEGWRPESWRVGFEHESNGKEAEDSRSLNYFFVRPEWRYRHDARHTLAVAPKFYIYVDKHENDDIEDYRGVTDLNIRYGDDDGLLLSTILRMGWEGKGSAQADITWPFKKPVFGKVGGFFHTQIFTGYGQTLLDYNENADTQLRFGISLVR